MSETPPLPITPEDFDAYVVSKGISTACPRCPITGWTLHESENMRGMGGPTMLDSGSLNLGRFLPMLVLTCNHCGYVWLLARVPVQNWLKARDDAR